MPRVVPPARSRMPQVDVQWRERQTGRPAHTRVRNNEVVRQAIADGSRCGNRSRATNHAKVINDHLVDVGSARERYTDRSAWQIATGHENGARSDVREPLECVIDTEVAILSCRNRN